MPEDRLHLLTFASPPSAEGADSKPFEVIRVGDFRKGGREVPVTSADLDRAVENFDRWNQMGQQIPVDYDHSFATGGGSAAAGWYSKLYRKGDSLFAQVKWLPDAAEKIASGVYRFFSPEFASDWQNETGDSEGFTIVAGALTNRPFLRGLKPVALSQEVGEAAVEAGADTLGRLEEMLERFASKVNSDSPDETLGRVAETKDTKPKVEKPEPEKSGDEPQTFTVEIDGKEESFSAEQIVEFRTAALKATQATDENEKLSQRLGTVEKDLRTERFTAIFDRALREGRVDAKDETREKWSKRVETFGLEATKELLNELPAETIPVRERGDGAADSSTTAPDGVDQERHELNAKIERYAQEKNISYGEAFEHFAAEAEAAEAL